MAKKLNKRHTLPQLFKKGHAKLGGRKKGTRNKVTRDVKEAILLSFEAIGGQYWLESLSRRDRKSYAALLGKLLPMQLTGKDGAPITLKVSTEDEEL